MTITILALQVALPLALLLWLALSPAGSRAGFALQTAGTGVLLFVLARVAQWALPVWWLPWVYGGLWLTATVASALRIGLAGVPLAPKSLWGWSGLLLSLLLLSVGGYYGARAMAGRNLPPAGIIDIANPFGPGHYLVAHGGSNTLVNGHMRTLDPAVERFQPWRGQSYAVDLFGLGYLGLRARGWRPSDPELYAIFGATLYAPCDGTVIAVEGTMPDFDVPQSDPVNRLGNHVILRCGGAEVVLAHMRQNTVTALPGQEIAVDDRLGQVGNSGASTEPHLHIHAQRPAPEGASPISGDPLGLRIAGQFLVRGDRLLGRAE
jgi:hypothetical protein